MCACLAHGAKERYFDSYSLSAQLSPAHCCSLRHTMPVSRVCTVPAWEEAFFPPPSRPASAKQLNKEPPRPRGGPFCPGLAWQKLSKSSLSPYSCCCCCCWGRGAAAWVPCLILSAAPPSSVLPCSLSPHLWLRSVCQPPPLSRWWWCGAFWWRWRVYGKSRKGVNFSVFSPMLRYVFPRCFKAFSILENDESRWAI